MRWLFWLVVALVATALALFAASNREAVSLGWWPFGFVMQVPLYLAILVAGFVGLLIGMLSAWLAAGRWRREARRRGRRIAALERELAATQAQLPSAGDIAPPRLAARG